MKKKNKGTTWMIEILRCAGWEAYLSCDTRQQARDWIAEANGHNYCDDNKYRVVQYVRWWVARERFNKKLQATGHI